MSQNHKSSFLVICVNFYTPKVQNKLFSDCKQVNFYVYKLTKSNLEYETRISMSIPKEMTFHVNLTKINSISKNKHMSRWTDVFEDKA